MYCVINGRIAIETSRHTGGAFYHCGAWYIWERDAGPSECDGCPDLERCRAGGRSSCQEVKTIYNPNLQ